MRNRLAVLCLLLCSAMPAAAQVSIHIGLPDVSIGINVPSYPRFVRMPGYPVYYVPSLRRNYFFYDGLYWVYRNDNWYASYWYNGPWGLVAPYAVPLYVLRIPVRYYYDRPARFSGWRQDALPRWGEVWGSEWDQRRRGWDRWNRTAAPAPAPLPVYQRQYAGDRYPRIEQQPVLQGRYYTYRPRETVVRQFYQEQGVRRVQAASAPAAVVRQAPQQSRVVAQQPVARKEAKPPKEHKVHKVHKEAKPPKETKAYKEPKPPKGPKAYKEPKPPKEPKARREPSPAQEPKAFKEPRPQHEPKAAHEPKGPHEPKPGKEPKAEKEHKGK